MSGSVVIEIHGANDSFSDGMHEFARLLREAANRLEKFDGTEDYFVLQDTNGLTVGFCEYSCEDEEEDDGDVDWNEEEE